MKATIDFDDQLYRRLKVEAAKQGRTVRELVTEGVRYVLDGEPHASPPDPQADGAPQRWFGVLSDYARAVGEHSLPAIRASVASARAPERPE